LRGETILKPWRVWVFSIVLFTAAFTPTADPFTMLLLAVPLCLLYFMAGGIALLVDKRRSRKASKAFDGVTPIESAQEI
jgi:sec-independent protein translocase protein TatC